MKTNRYNPNAPSYHAVHCPPLWRPEKRHSPSRSHQTNVLLYMMGQMMAKAARRRKP